MERGGRHTFNISSCAPGAKNKPFTPAFNLGTSHYQHPLYKSSETMEGEGTESQSEVEYWPTEIDT